MNMPDASFISFYDFHYLWAAGRIALDGGNVYDQQTLSIYLSQTGWPASESAQAITHPPTALLLYMPFALLPYHIAAWLWCFLSLVVVAFAFWFHRKDDCQLGRDLNRSQIVQAIFALLLFPPFFSTIIIGQNNSFLLLGIALFSFMSRLKRPLLAGCALSLTALKPHLFLPFYTALFISARSHRANFFYLSLGFVGSIALESAASLALYPTGFANYYSAITSFLASSGGYHGASLGQIFSSKFGLESARLIVLMIGLSLSFLIAFKKSVSNESLMNQILPLSLLTSPYVWPHSFLTLLFPYLVMIRSWFTRSDALTKVIILVIAILGILDVVRPLEFGFLMVLIPICVLIHSFRSIHYDCAPMRAESISTRHEK